jgi:hypothetical protein
MENLVCKHRSWQKFRCIAVAAMIIGIGTYLGCDTPSNESATTIATSDQNDQAVSPPSGQQILDARLALCSAAADEFGDIQRGHSGDKDVIILANQSFIGQKAGGATIGHEWLAYKDGQWHDADCHALSTAGWAANEDYVGDPIDLPDGAIAQVVNATAP